MTAGVMQDGGDQGVWIVAKLKQFKTKVGMGRGRMAGRRELAGGGRGPRSKVYGLRRFAGRSFSTVSHWVEVGSDLARGPTQEEAIAEAKEAGKRLAKGVAGVPEVSSADWACYSRSRQILGTRSVFRWREGRRWSRISFSGWRAGRHRSRQSSIS